ncbi:MAG: MFS transporter [Polyangiales bacterium]
MGSLSTITTPNGRVVTERAILFLVGAVQFVNILDFMMIAPLGPRLAPAIGMPESHLADATAAYTLAAGIAGVIGSFFLDRFDRRKALAVCMVGLVLGTAAGGLATDFRSLVLARMLAGAFGGPATSLAIAIVSDVIPQERRGKAMGAIMGAFAAASVLGVPASLALAELGNWRTPFFGVAVLGFVVVTLAVVMLPPLRIHLEGPKHAQTPLREMLARPAVISSYMMTLTVNAGAFVLIPNISTFVQNNLGLPETQLKWMYLAGGVVSFFTTRATGAMVDRVGTLRVATAGSLFQIAIVYAAFVNLAFLPYQSHLYLCLYSVFMSFMFANGVRNVAYSTLTTRVPRPNERVRFMSIQSSVQHLSAAAGASLSSRMLGVTADHKLTGIPVVGVVSMFAAAVLPFLVFGVERRLSAEGTH